MAALSLGTFCLKTNAHHFRGLRLGAASGGAWGAWPLGLRPRDPLKPLAGPQSMIGAYRLKYSGARARPYTPSPPTVLLMPRRDAPMHAVQSRSTLRHSQPYTSSSFPAAVYRPHASHVTTHMSCVRRASWCGWLRDFMAHLRYIWVRRSDGPERRPLEGARMRHQRPCRRPLRPERAALALWATPVAVHATRQ